MSTVPEISWRRCWISRIISVWKTGFFSGWGLNPGLFEYEAYVLPTRSRRFVEQTKALKCDILIEWVNSSCTGKISAPRYCYYTYKVYVLCTVHCNKIIQYKPKKCTVLKLLFRFLIFDAFYVFRSRSSIFRKTVVYTVLVWYILHER